MVRYEKSAASRWHLAECRCSFFLVAAVFPAAFTSYGQKEMFAPWLTPSPAHLLGTNALGYDIFTELVYGTRQTLLIGVSSSVLTLVLGSVIGTLAAGKSVVGGVLNGVINILCFCQSW